ncbi:MAG: hypothetical protein ACOC0N_10125 [Chroococcales cyanobacterium]
MTQVNTFEQAQQGNTEAIASLIRQWLRPREVTPKVKQKGDCLRIILESDPVSDPETAMLPIREGLQGIGISGVNQVAVYGRDTIDEIPEWHEEFTLADTPGMTLVDESAAMIGTVIGTVSGAATVMSGAAEAVGTLAADTGKAMADSAASATLETSKRVGKAFGWIEQNPLVRRVTKVLPFNWLFILDRVDLDKAQSDVQRLQAKYPQETPEELAHRLMVQKASLTAGTGFASSLIPGFATALFAIDLAATMALQAEMLYQIAGVYGLDIQNSERKGEILTIFGLALGGGQVLKLGGGYAARAGLLGVLRNIPIAGSAIGASTNAAMTYALGYAACRFYEAKVNPFTSEATLANSEAASEAFLENAIAQQIVMDQILVHVMLANDPTKSKEEVLKELRQLNLSPASIEAIAASFDSLPSLESLLNQVNDDFAVPLLCQCKKLTDLDSSMTPQEADVIETITNKFDADIESLQSLPC